ncbi:MAG: hypothetical protein JWL69_166, partial [Phycisphaerales bacterium]|nr:hypothetical protein [Phycisphaerales bacterium]
GRMRDSQTGAQPTFEPVEALEVGGQSYQSWQEAVEREVKLDSITLGEMAANLRPTKFTFPGRSDSEPLRDQGGRTVGMLVREQQPIAGAIELSAGKKAPDVFLITARIENHIPFSDDRAKDRDAALMRALVSTHTILGVRGGQFVSLTDPAEPLRAFTADCRNVGCWPVLVGEAGEKDTMLSSPIILYDYPQIAPESSGDLFDSTEIDEILTLRIMTLTDEEKRQGAAVDERVRALLDRTEALARERLMDLHGAMRGMRPHIEEAAFRLGGTQPGAVVPQEEHHA